MTQYNIINLFCKNITHETFHTYSYSFCGLIAFISACSKESDDDTINSFGYNSSNSNPLIRRWRCECGEPDYPSFYTFNYDGTVLIEGTPAELNFTVTYTYNPANNQLVLAGFVNVISWPSPTNFIIGGESYFKVD
jgi:hypothetical protein